MISIKHIYNEGDTIWFIDADANGAYAERGTIVAFKQNGDMVISFYAGMCLMSKETIFPTKQECEKFIYLDKIAKEMMKSE